ncbi:hypothetical protein Tco_1254723 [Tanacetum coccineum]
MLEKSMYDSWTSRIRLFIKGKTNGRMMLDSIENGPLVYPTIEENGHTRPKKYSELTEAQQLQDDCDVQETNIILHGLPPDVYALVNHQEAAKDIWDKVKLLTKGTELPYQERKCRLYNFKFASDDNAASSSQYQVSKCSSTGMEQVYHLPPTMISSKFPQLDSGLAVTTFQQGEDLIDCINKAMTFLSDVASRFPSLNNQLRMSSNTRNQATIQDGRVIVQQVQGRQTQSFVGIGNRGIATTPRGNYAASQAKTEDLDAYDSDCDDITSAKAVMMANLSSCDSDDLSEDTNSSAPNDLLVLSLVKQMTDQVANLDKENQINKMAMHMLTKLMANLSSFDLDVLSKDNSGENQNALTFNQLFEINELNAQSQEKDTIIRKLKDRIKSLTGKESVEKVKKDIDEIETIDIELEHNLNAQLQEKVFVVTTLKNELRKLKGKSVVDTVVSTPIATTIAPGMFKLDIEPISHRHKNNRDAHEDYLKKTIIILTPYMELLVYVSKTCPNLPKPSEKLVAVTSMNKDKKVRFAKPVTSSSNIPKQTDSLKPKDSNKPLWTSIRVNTTTSASRSKPSGNTKKNKITRPPSSNLKNKVEVYPRLNLV